MRMHFEPTKFSVKKKEKRVSRTYMNLGGGLNRPRASETDPTVFLHWTTTPLPYDLDLTGPIELPVGRRLQRAGYGLHRSI